jgi:secreted Zn-dependent insulinase-like peptidase
MVNFCDNELIKLTFVSFEMAKKALPEYSCAKSKHLCGLFPNDDAILIIIAKSYEDAERYIMEDPIVIKKYYEYTIDEFIEANESNNWLLDDL